MDFASLKICFEERIADMKALVDRTNKSPVLLVQQFPIASDTDIVVPRTRESLSNVISFVELGELETLDWVLGRADGVFDAIVVDSDVKRPGSRELVRRAIAGTKKSKLFLYSDNATWAGSAVHFVQAIEGPLLDATVVVCGHGHLHTGVVLRLLEMGAQVALEHGAQELALNRNVQLAVGASDRVIGLHQIDPASARVVLGTSVKEASISAELVQKLPAGAHLYDLGIGNLAPSTVELAQSRGLTVYRFDNRAGVSSMILGFLETDHLVNRVMGRLELRGVELVSGGVMGRNGAIVVDNVHAPQFIVGIADGGGRVKYQPENGEEQEKLAFINRLLAY